MNKNEWEGYSVGWKRWVGDEVCGNEKDISKDGKNGKVDMNEEMRRVSLNGRKVQHVKGLHTLKNEVDGMNIERIHVEELIQIFR